MKKNLLVGQSGGPTAVINASLAGVISAGFRKLGGKVYGCLNGIEGIEDENIISLEKFRDDEELRLLRQTPSSILGSCRKKLPEPDEAPEVYSRIFDVFCKYEIGCFFYIGGNDSMDTVDKLNRYAENKGIDTKIIGVPKTIDNDLALTDHTPGYGSAAKFVANSMRQLALDTGVYKMPSVIVLEIMGRNAGWLAAAAALANDAKLRAADIICLPEHPFDIDRFIERVGLLIREQKTVMIAVSEGIKDADGRYIEECTARKGVRGDKFAHAALGGVGRTVENRIAEELGLKTRTIELSTLQRCWSAGTSLCDAEEAFAAGCAAVEFAHGGMSGVVSGFVRKDGCDYGIEIVPMPVCKIANFEKKVPASMISPDGFGVTSEFINYAAPLIQGEPELLYRNGVIRFAEI